MSHVVSGGAIVATEACLAVSTTPIMIQGDWSSDRYV
jgi:hypothetical protein